MKAIILAISLFFIVNHVQAKSPVIDDTVSGKSFDRFQENHYKVHGFKKDQKDEQQIRNPSSDKKQAVKKEVEADPVPQPWSYEE